MRRFNPISFLFALAAFLYPVSSHADIEALAIAPEIWELGSEVATEIEDQAIKLKNAEEALAQAAEATNSVAGDIKNVAGTVTDPTSIVEDALDSAASVVTETLDGFKNLGQTTPQTEVSDTVKESFANTYNATEQEKQTKEIMLRYTAGRNLARLYLRALQMRLAIQKESFDEAQVGADGAEVDDGRFESISAANAAKTKLTIRATARWNRMLALQAAMAEYARTLEMRNVTISTEDEDDSK
jgi:hypothetical protein